jgi:PPOX class probable FMN-dependent enzyme
MNAPWIAPLRQALAAEFTSGPVIATLATVDRDGHARARCIVVRRVNDDGTMLMVTDGRSGKACQARHHSQVELVFWLPKARLQFRVKAAARFIAACDGDPLLAEMWQALSDETRATFFWPPPGRTREPDSNFSRGVSADVEPPVDFEVVVFEVESVDRLDVGCFPHIRTHWVADGVWREQALNP